jgi:hypothetical protein
MRGNAGLSQRRGGYNPLPMLEAFALALLVAGTLFWVDTLRAREAALVAGRAACERYGLMLLDDTVAVTRMRFSRNAEGRLRVARTYGFEFSDTGNNRRHGAISLVGGEPADISFEPYETTPGELRPPANHLTRIK